MKTSNAHFKENDVIEFLDISVPLSRTLPIWPGDAPFVSKSRLSMKNGEPCNLSEISLGIHTGTHVDAPFHFVENGPTIEKIPWERFIGPCVVVEVNADKQISKKDLKMCSFQGQSRVLLKTKNSDLWRKSSGFEKNFVALDDEAAQFLVDSGVQLIGIDYLSVESFFSTDPKVHQILLGNNVTILEGLDLSAAQEGVYDLICLPLNLPGFEGAPARAILRKNFFVKIG